MLKGFVVIYFIIVSKLPCRSEVFNVQWPKGVVPLDRFKTMLSALENEFFGNFMG